MKEKIPHPVKKFLWENFISSEVSWDKIKKFVYNECLNGDNIDYFNYIKNLGWNELHKIIQLSSDNIGMLSFSQSGEDAVFKALTRNKKNGFFVDVGAHHPIRFSNTFSLYLDGWRGINIDPIPGIQKIFDSIRPEDINLEYAVGKRESSFFYQFYEGAYNTFDQNIAESIINKKISKLIQKISINKFPLAEVLDKHLPDNKTIDLLSVDAEGLDVEILNTNNWEKYRPLYICAECHTTDDSRSMNPKHVLEKNGYKFAVQTEFSTFYSRQD
jgi:FkbM family methyltransferase